MSSVRSLLNSNPVCSSGVLKAIERKYEKKYEKLMELSPLFTWDSQTVGQSVSWMEKMLSSRCSSYQRLKTLCHVTKKGGKCAEI